MKHTTTQVISATLLIGGILGFAATGYAYELASERQSYEAASSTRGGTVAIPESTVSYLCGDFDGCTVRLGMYNWDGTGRTASRESLLYYNTTTKTWRTSAGDVAGQNANGVTEHIMQAWACYFTDGSYSSWSNLGDYTMPFGLLSWNQYVAGCRLTIID